MDSRVSRRSFLRSLLLLPLVPLLNKRLGSAEATSGLPQDGGGSKRADFRV